MVFILNANFTEGTLVKKALQSFYGVGPAVSGRLMARHLINPTCKVGMLATKQVLGLTAELTNMTIENNLRRQVRENISRLRDMGTYRGKRHAMNLPVRGQITKTQISTARKLNQIDRLG